MAQPGTGRREIRVVSLPEPISHYTDAVVHDDLVFISGCLATDAARNLVGGEDAVAQTRQVLANLAVVLAEVGAGYQDVLKVTVFLTDIEDRTRINPVRQEFFGDARPASTLVEVSRLAVPGAKVEIEAIACLPAR
ncbi:MAG: RidA family protein [Streptosporangiales bacterium]|nr:RidA family protein [Streptosporangiales bacterium]